MADPKAPDAHGGALSIQVQADFDHHWVAVRLIGRLDIFTYLDLKRKLAPLLNEHHGLRMVFDLAQVTFVASSGWSVFLATRAHLQRDNGHMALVGLGEDLLRSYQAMKMDSLVPIYGSATEARVKMGGQA